MQRFRPRLALAALFAACGAPATDAPSGEPAAAEIARTDSLFAEWDRPDSPGCSVGIIRDGELIFTRGYGSASLDYGVPLDESSVFYIASTSKQFTAAAIARLALDGRISLDDEIQEYVPEIPRYDAPVTIRHLLHHTSGLRDYLALMQMAGRDYEDYWDNASGIALVSRQRALNFDPGSEHLYSNTGYILLAEIVERVTGQSLQEYTRDVFFGPLEMSATTWGEDFAAVIPGRVVSYAERDDGSYRTWLKHFHGKGDGNLLTSVEDLAQWDGIFYETDGPWAELTATALEPGVLNDGTTLDYAFGLVHDEYRDVPIVAHGGGMLGFRTQFMRFPSERFSVICLCNLGSINPNDLSYRLADIWLFGDGGPEPETDDDGEPADETPAGETAEADTTRWQPTTTELARYAGFFYSEELDASWDIAPADEGLAVTIGRRTIPLHAIEPGALSLDPRGFTRLRFGSPDGAGGFTLDAGRIRGVTFVRR